MSVQLFSAATFVSAWENIFLPWQREAGAQAWNSPLPTLVVVPSRSDAYWLKTRLLQAGLHGLGIRFVVAAELRDQLMEALAISHRVPLREHLQLLLAIAAESIPAEAPEETRAAAHAVAGAPDHLLHAIDQLSAGGWEFTEAGPVALRPIVEEFERLLEGCQFQLMHEVDRQLQRLAAVSPPKINRILVAGFNGLHWPIWPLLRAAVNLSQHATVALLDPRIEAEELDSTWIGTWEEAFGAASPIPAVEPVPESFADVLRLPESSAQSRKRQENPVSAIEFLVGQNTREQARAVVQKTLQFLADKSCTRLGILLPAGGALARTITSLLAEKGVPHNDGIAHFAQGPFEEPAWPAWLALQENPRIDILLRFLQVHPCAEFFENLELDQIDRELRRAFGEVLIDDLRLLTEMLASREGTSARVAEGLRHFPFLPEAATFTEYCKQTRAIFGQLGWSLRAQELDRLSLDWAERVDKAVTRRAFVRWLSQVLVSMSAERDASGNHPYSRVHLLPYPQAEPQPWSHLILAGLNEGGWPLPFDDSGYIGEEEIEALNRRIRVLNKSIVRQGRQGEGHWTVEDGKTMCLGPVQKRDLTVRQFLNTLESVTVGFAACASLSEESQPARHLNPSDFFTRLYLCARGKSVSQAALKSLRDETAAWLQNATPPSQNPEPISPAVLQTRVAFDARRDRSQPFGQYEFALREPLKKPIALAATSWERALQSPAGVWMRHLLGVEPLEEGIDGDGWSLATGQWVHRWLGAVAGPPLKNTFVELPAPEEIRRRTRAEADTFKATVSAWLVTAGLSAEPPDWWISGWRQAVSTAGVLARRLSEVEGCTHMASEYVLPKVPVALGEDKILRLHGRIDLLLGESAPHAASGLPNEPWIVDYKTGNRRTLTPSGKEPAERLFKLGKKLAAGESLQLALYALALRQMGAESLGVSVLSPNLSLENPQLDLADINAQQWLWLGLHAMQESGAFGMRGPLRNDFSFTHAYPLATLAIDEAILDEKWRRTHPALAIGGGSEEDGE